MTNSTDKERLQQHKKAGAVAQKIADNIRDWGRSVPGVKVKISARVRDDTSWWTIFLEESGQYLGTVTLYDRGRLDVHVTSLKDVVQKIAKDTVASAGHPGMWYKGRDR